MYWKVIDEAPAEQADTKLQAYRWDPFSQPIMYRPDANGCIEERIMAAEERSDPTTFRVESRAQFVEGINTYFEHDAVENVFKPFWNDRVLTEESAGRVAYDYKIHCDPALVNDMFSVMVAHAEDAPEDDSFSIRYKHLVIDYYTVYKPQDFADGHIQYEAVLADIERLMTAFRPTSVTCDQFNSAFIVQTLQKYAANNGMSCQVYEETATGAKNFKMYENLKFSINTGLVHSYYDSMNKNENWRCLLQAMLEQVQLVNGRVDKPRSKEFGHLDLVDCVAVLCMQLLGDQSSMRRELLNSAFVDNSSVLQERFQSARLSNWQNMNSPMSGFGRRY